MQWNLSIVATIILNKEGLPITGGVAFMRGSTLLHRSKLTVYERQIDLPPLVAEDSVGIGACVGIGEPISVAIGAHVIVPCRELNTHS